MIIQAPNAAVLAAVVERRLAPCVERGVKSGTVYGLVTLATWAPSLRMPLDRAALATRIELAATLGSHEQYVRRAVAPTSAPRRG